MNKTLTNAKKVLNVRIGNLLRDADGNIDVSRNPREPWAYDPQNPEFTSLADVTRENLKETGEVGWTDMPEVMEAADFKESGTYIIIKGHRRFLVLDHVAGKTNPNITVRSVVYPHMDDWELFNLLIDHGNRVDLTKVEVFYAIEKGDKAGLTHKQLALKFRPLLERMGRPLSEKQLEKIGDVTTEVGKAKLLDRYKGQIQNHLRASQGPVVMREAWIAKLRGKQAWPADGELIQGKQIFDQECKDKPGVFTQLEPGPKFLEFWGKIVTARETAEADGSKPKSQAMMGHKDVDKAQTDTASRLMKAAFAYAKRDIPKEKFDVFDAIAVELEKLLTDEQKARIMATYDPPKPTAEQPKESIAA